MRGVRAALPARRAKADVLLVTARYDAEGRLMIARGNVRHDQIWSDVQLFDRRTLVDLLQTGKRVDTAISKDLAGDFSLLSNVSLIQTDGRDRLAVKGTTASHDDLGLPVF